MRNPTGRAAVDAFRVDIPDDVVDDLRARIARTRWPAASDDGWDRGVPGRYLRGLSRYWAGEFDWRAQEAWLNSFPQFRTEVDGAVIHFVHVRSAQPGARPLVITHGWPGSFVEFLDLVGPLTDPVAHGGCAEDAFHVVLPSLPGHGFSDPTPDTGWSIGRIAEAWDVLMTRLGYPRYLASGGDFGALVALEVAARHPDHVEAVQVSFLITPPTPDVPDDQMDPEDRERVDGVLRFLTDPEGSTAVQRTRPRTVAFGLSDSPVGQLAWIVDKFQAWTDSVDVPEEAVDRDILLTLVSLSWFTSTAGSSAELYREIAEAQRASGGEPPGSCSPVPVGVAVFPREIVRPVRALAERRHRIRRWSEFDHGGHFAALEQPDLLLRELRATFRKPPAA